MRKREEDGDLLSKVGRMHMYVDGPRDGSAYMTVLLRRMSGDVQVLSAREHSLNGMNEAARCEYVRCISVLRRRR